MQMELILTELSKYSQEKYKNFQEKLVPEKEIMGVPVPQLEKIAKQLVKNGQELTYLETYVTYNYECDMLYGMLVAYTPLDKRETYIRKFIGMVDNWAVCDYVVARWKFIKKEPQKYLSLIHELLETHKEWSQRVAYVILLDYYLNDKYLAQLLEYLKYPFEEAYYTQMAVAWLMSMGLVKYSDTFEKLLSDFPFSSFVYQKTLQKAIESKQVPLEKKNQYRKMKKNRVG